MGRGQTDTHTDTRSSRLLDQLGPEGRKVMTEFLEIISRGSNFSRLLTLPLVFTIIHNMHKKFIQGCENGSTFFALKLILSFLFKDML